MESIKQIFIDDVGIYCRGKNKTGTTLKIGNIYNIFYTGGNASRIFNWLYKDSIENLRLDRKYAKYVEYSRLIAENSNKNVIRRGHPKQSFLEIK